MTNSRFLGGIGDQMTKDIALTGARSVMGYHLGVWFNAWELDCHPHALPLE